jgi:hypothetical protein
VRSLPRSNSRIFPRVLLSKRRRQAVSFIVQDKTTEQ